MSSGDEGDDGPSKVQVKRTLSNYHLRQKAYLPSVIIKAPQEPSAPAEPVRLGPGPSQLGRSFSGRSFPSPAPAPRNSKKVDIGEPNSANGKTEPVNGRGRSFGGVPAPSKAQGQGQAGRAFSGRALSSNHDTIDIGEANSAKGKAEPSKAHNKGRGRSFNGVPGLAKGQGQAGRAFSGRAHSNHDTIDIGEADSAKGKTKAQTAHKQSGRSIQGMGMGRSLSGRVMGKPTYLNTKSNSSSSPEPRRSGKGDDDGEPPLPDNYDGVSEDPDTESNTSGEQEHKLPGEDWNSGEKGPDSNAGLSADYGGQNQAGKRRMPQTH